MRQNLAKLLAGTWVILAGVVTQAQAAQFEEFGDYVIHYNTVPTDFLSAKVATEYEIKRSRNRVMLSLSVLDRSSSPHKAVPAEVRATAANLTGQLKTLDMRPVREGEAIYYIGVLGVDDEEVLDFTVHVRPQGQAETLTLSFREQFFTR